MTGETGEGKGIGVPLEEVRIEEGVTRMRGVAFGLLLYDRLAFCVLTYGAQSTHSSTNSKHLLQTFASFELYSKVYTKGVAYNLLTFIFCVFVGTTNATLHTSQHQTIPVKPIQCKFVMQAWECRNAPPQYRPPRSKKRRRKRHSSSSVFEPLGVQHNNMYNAS